jgi:hypothetical protein
MLKGRCAKRRQCIEQVFSQEYFLQPRVMILFSLLLAILELSDTKVYEPRIRARLGTAAHFCEVAVLSDAERTAC